MGGGVSFFFTHLVYQFCHDCRVSVPAFIQKWWKLWLPVIWRPAPTGIAMVMIIILVSVGKGICFIITLAIVREGDCF